METRSHSRRLGYLGRGTSGIRRGERRTVTECNWVVRKAGVQGTEEFNRMAATPQLCKPKTGDTSKSVLARWLCWEWAYQGSEEAVTGNTCLSKKRTRECLIG